MVEAVSTFCSGRSGQVREREVASALGVGVGVGVGIGSGWNEVGYRGGLLIGAGKAQESGKVKESKQIKGLVRDWIRNWKG